MFSDHPVARLVRCLAVLLLFAATAPVDAQQTVPPGFDDTFLAAVWSPTALAFTPDGRLLVASQAGQLYVYRDGALTGTPALDLGTSVCNYRERGLLGVTVDPEFASNHFIYLTYIFNKLGTCDAEYTLTPVGRLSRFELGNDNSVDPASERILIDNVPSAVGVHNLGDVKFGRDGYLYVTVGDGGCDYAGNSGCFDSNNAAQDLNALVGKVLRVTRDGGIPPDNPFIGPDSVRCSADGVVAEGFKCQEIFATGLRNPWRLAFDPNAAGTRFFINDVGQDTWEEINEGVAGANYGWNDREGFCAQGSAIDCSPSPPPGLTNPVFAYGRADGCASVTGGAFVPNGVWPASFDGAYLFGDFVCGAIFKLVRAADGTFAAETFIGSRPDFGTVDLAFGPTENGATALYYLSYADGGQLRRVTPAGASNRPPVASLTATPDSGLPPLAVDFNGSGSSDPDGDALTFQWDFGDGAPGAATASVQHTYTAAGTYTVTLRVQDSHGATSTATAFIDAGNTQPQPAIVTPTPDQRFAVGETIVLQGRAVDAEDGVLPDSSLSWRVLLHHNTHTHPFLPPTTGNNLSIRAPAPENLEAAATSYLEIQLTATDTNGRPATVTQPLMPRFTRLEFLSDPPGASLVIDNAQVTAPVSFMSWVNFDVAVQAASQVNGTGTTLVFASWSDAGAASHTVVTPASGSTYTATFVSEAIVVSAPFGGVAATLPGTIQAENFDNGGAGVAYFDSSPGNYGGQYRDTDVDLEIARDSGGGYNIGWISPGEWLNYTVNVTAAGTYSLDFRVASAGRGGTFHVESNSIDITGPVVIPNTGGWQSWSTVSKPGVNLAAGQQVWRIVFDSIGPDGVLGNINHISVTGSGGPVPVPQSTPFGGTPIRLPATIEAEYFDDGGQGIAYSDTTTGNSGGQFRPTDVDLEATTDAGGGYNIGWMVAGEWLNYTVDVAAAGTYDIEVRVASPGSGGAFHIEVNGVDVTGRLTIPQTDGWQNWTTVRAAGIGLSAGRQVWRLVLDANGSPGAVGNVNWIRASSSSSAAALVRQPYLQQVTSTSAIVVWTTRDPGIAQVRFGTAGGPAVSASADTRLFSAVQTGLAYDFYQHEARLTGLTAASTYTYDVFMNGVDVTPGQDTLRTAPATGGGSVRFIAFGDSGVGSTAQRQLASRMAADTFDLALHGGDVAYGTAAMEGGGSYPQYDDWVFSIYAPWMRSRPMFPSIGNHDDEVANARPYRDVFVLPEHGATATYPDHAERYYSFDYGPVHFVALDTELAFADSSRRAAQLAWLEADLSSTTQPWRVVFFHRPPYNSGTHHGSDLAVRQAFAPIFERYHVQLAITAHEHDYERSVPWREFVATGGAVTYVVTGGGGAGLYPSGFSRWTATSASVHHYVRATVGNCVLDLEAVGLDGAVIDRYSLDRCAQAADAVAPQVFIASPANGATATGTLAVQVTALDDTRVDKVDLYVDGVLRSTDLTAPYAWTLDTRTLSDGVHVLEAEAHDAAGHRTRSSGVSFTAANGSTTARDVVLYASDVSVIHGNWSRLSSTTGAGGLKMTSEDRGWSSTGGPQAAPDDYFEATFDAPAGAYRLWLRLRGAADSKFNESVWVQFSDASDAAGASLWPIGTTRALLVNLEDCGGCGVSSWGWQDNAWWLGESSVVRFTTGGPHRIRIQTREDGVDVDQIVLSPVNFFTSAPGAVRDDRTIVPK